MARAMRRVLSDSSVGARRFAVAAIVGGLIGGCGADGAQGPAGPKGDKGDAGPAGQPGTPGTPGDNGDNGATGGQGDPGASGEAGAPGATGSDGETVSYDTESTGYVSSQNGPGRFALVAGGVAATILVSDDDFAGVQRVASDLQSDIERVTGVRPELSNDDGADLVVIVGTVGKSAVVDQLIADDKLDVSELEGKWEMFTTQIVEAPMDGVERALVIAGSDQRGTIYGAYDLSAQIGVSPWYWWDDVPAAQKSALYVLPGKHTNGEPKVKYRGFFINDENPASGNWAPKMFGPGLAEGFPNGFNHHYWEKVFEAALRLKANYVWPAVWGRAFGEDDPENHATATRYGIVMGTSHEAPMMQGIEEWNRHAKAAQRDAEGNITTEGSDPYDGTGEWRFSVNSDALKAHWTKGMQRMAEENIEGVITLGMRGPGDVSLPVEDGITLIEEVFAAQREIIETELGKDPSEVPQVWTLYKEIQGYWDAGIRVPDDVTVVWCDDNWGNMKRLPDLTAEPRAGGYGLYYHFDYVGGGRNYKWVDTNHLPNVWEQLHAAYSYGVDRLWMVNVGDLKNEELPLQFFMDYAWNPDAIPVENIGDWERKWAAQQFGDDYADTIADFLAEYARLQSDRKPELLNRRVDIDWDLYESEPTTEVTNPAVDAITYNDSASPFSLTNYGELERVTEEWTGLAARVELIGALLPDEYQDAYFELVQYQVAASANLYELRLAGFKNQLYAAQGRAATTDMAAYAEARLEQDLELSDYYNTELADGKWEGWQSQPKISYGAPGNPSWQQQEYNYNNIQDFIWPEVVRLDVPQPSEMGIAISGSANYWTADGAGDESEELPVLATFSPYQTQPEQYIEIFNRGTAGFDYTVEAQLPVACPYGWNGDPNSTTDGWGGNNNTPCRPWLTVTSPTGRVTKETRLTLRVDWTLVPTTYADPEDTTQQLPVEFPLEVPIVITDEDDNSVTVTAFVDSPTKLAWQPNRFIEANGYVSMEAEHYSRAVETEDVSWQRLPEIGRTGSGITPSPVTAESAELGDESPRLEYDIHTFSEGDVDVWVYVSPRNNFQNWEEGLQYAVSVDDAEPKVVNLSYAVDLNGNGNKVWERHTTDNVALTYTSHTLEEAGEHTVKVWMVSPGVIVQKIVLDAGGMLPSYFGPPESYRMGEGPGE